MQTMDIFLTSLDYLIVFLQSAQSLPELSTLFKKIKTQKGGDTT